MPGRTASASAPPDWAARIPDELASQMGALRAAATENAAMQRRWTAARVVIGGLSGLLACLYAVALVRMLTGRARFPALAGPAGELGAAYDRLLRWGGRLGRPAFPADTPREYAAALGSTVAGMVGRVRVFQGGAARAAQALEEDVRLLAEAYEAATYGPEPASLPGASAAEPWPVAGLWGTLRRLWLARLTARPK